MGTHILGYQNWISPLRHAILGIALMGLAACGPQKFDAQVSRFNQMPVPQGQSFTIKGVEPGAENRLQFQYYAKMVADNMIQQGYSQATTPANAQMTVQLGFKMDGGREKVTSTPSMGRPMPIPAALAIAAVLPMALTIPLSMAQAIMMSKAIRFIAASWTCKS